MQDVSRCRENERDALAVFDSFGRHRMDYELIRGQRLAVIDGRLYRLQPGEFYNSQKRVRAEHVQFWRTTIDDVIMSQQKRQRLYHRLRIIRRHHQMG